MRDRRDAGTLIVVSTHYLGVITRYDRLAFLCNCSVLALDSPATIQERTDTSTPEDAILEILGVPVPLDIDRPQTETDR